MKTRVLSRDQIDLAVDYLRNQKPVVFPTETVYGLGALLFEEESVSKIFQIKKRPADNPLIAHIFHMEQVDLLAEEVPPSFYALAQAFWPGPLTMIVKKRKEVPAIVTASQRGVAIRMPSHPIARELLEKVKEPLVAPSANLSGRPSPTCVEDVLEDLEGRVDLVLDGGVCEVGIESSVVYLMDNTPLLLRPGRISKKEIEAVLHQELLTLSNQEASNMSPGVKYRHYAPQAEVELIFDPSKLSCDYFEPTQSSLYSELRKADRKGLKKVQVYCSETVLLDEALMNRLFKI